MVPFDFNLSPTMTLGHVGLQRPPLGYRPFWLQWSKRVWGTPPAMRNADPDDRFHRAAVEAGATHLIDSTNDVALACRIIEPKGLADPQGVVLTLHGYAAAGSMEDANPWTERGLHVARLRIRGFDGSTNPPIDEDEPNAGWITRGIQSTETWILPGAVADVVMAFRALREHYGPDMPISIHGESFGGGLAVVATSQIIGHDRVHRLALGVPSLGDWPWRLKNCSCDGDGSGAEIMRFVERHPSDREQIEQTLRILDAVLHADRVLCPVLCKLATRDDIVPAPSAAAIYNALGTSPSMKWRFITQFAHFDGGMADLRRHALFERLVGEFLDPDTDLIDLMHRWAERLHTGDDPPR